MKKKPNETESFNFERESVDDCFPLKTTNSRKSMAPVYAYLIIKEKTDEKHHLSQTALRKALAESPINIVLDRKSISRIVYTLADSGIGVAASKKAGVWYNGNVWYNLDY